MSEQWRSDREVEAAKKVLEEREKARIAAEERLAARREQEKRDYKGKLMADGTYHRNGKRYFEDGTEVGGMNDLVQHQSEINHKKHHKKHHKHSKKEELS